MQKPQSNVVKFIDDKPSSEDVIGNAKPVAEAIADVIVNDDNVKVIGLLGRWGSGKSTILKIVEEKLKAIKKDDNTSYFFFNFDSWLHQKDLPRRAFLEEIIDTGIKENSLEEKPWKERLARITGKTEETKTTTTPKLTLGGIFVFISIFLASFASNIIKTEILKDLANSKNNILSCISSFVLTPLIWLMIISPIFTLVILLVIGWYKKDKNQNNLVWLFLSQKTTDSETKVTKISPEPTLIEFRKTFQDLIDEFGAKNKRLVVVIDNLDRLVDEEAIQLWATIRGMFSETSSTCNNKKNKAKSYSAKIILPVDDDAIKNLFSGKDSSLNASERKRTEAFFDKTFDVTFYVSQSVLSDWRVFFRNKIKEAFGENISAEDVSLAMTLFEEKMLFDLTKNNKDKKSRDDNKDKKLSDNNNDDKESITDTTPTPRFLIKTINSTVSLYRQWRHEFSFASIMFFILYRNEILKGLREFFKDENDKIYKRNAPDWKKEIAGIYYGVDKKKSFQIFLKEPINISIQTGNKEDFEEHIKFEGATSILIELIEEKINVSDDSVEADYYGNLAVLINESKNIDTVSRKRLSSLVSDGWCKDSNYLSDISEYCAEYIAALKPNEIKTAGDILTASARKLSSIIQKLEMGDLQIKRLSVAIKALRDYADRYNEGTYYLVDIGSDIYKISKIINGIYEIDKVNVRAFWLKETASDIAAKIEGFDTFEENPGLIWRLIRSISGKFAIKLKDKKPLILDGLLDTALSDLKRLSADDARVLEWLNMLGVLMSNSKEGQIAFKIFDSFVSSGYLSQRFNEAISSKIPNVIESLIALYIIRGQKFSLPTNWNDINSTFKGLDEGVVSALRELREEDSLIYYFKQLKDANEHQAMLKDMLEFSIYETELNSKVCDFYFTNLIEIKKLIQEEDFKYLLEKLKSLDDFWERVSNLDDKSACNLLEVLSSLEFVDRTQIIKEVKSRVENNNKEDWEGEIKEQNGYSFEFLDVLHEDEKFKLSDDKILMNVVDELKIDFLKSTNNDFDERWEIALSLISDSETTLIVSKLVDEIKKGTGDIKTKINRIPKKFWKSEKITKECKQSAEYIVIPLLSDVAYLDILHENVDKLSRIYQHCGDDYRRLIPDRINDLYKSTISDVQQNAIVNKIANKLKIKLGKIAK